MTFPSVSFTPTVARIHPQTGEILTADNPSQPRAIAVDSSGMIITTPYSSGLSKLGLMSRAFEDKSFNSIRSLNRPLGFLYGGRAQGELIVENGITGHLDLQHMTALADSTSGTTVVYVPVANTPHVTEWRASVLDVGGMASTNNITVHSVSGGLEVPGSPGTFSSVVTISTDNQLVTWRYSPAYGNWYIVECEPPILPTPSVPTVVTAGANGNTASASSLGTVTVMSDTASLTSDGNPIYVTLDWGGTVTPACYRLIPYLDYSTDGGVTWTSQWATTRGGGIPGNGSYYSGGLDIDIHMSRVLVGTTLGQDVAFRFGILAYGTSGAFNSSTGDTAALNVLTIWQD
jgi:hypothetical protein